MVLVAELADFRPMPKAKRRNSKARRPQENFIRAWRKFRGRTLEDVAAEAGITFSHLGQIERCEAGYSWETLEDIASALDCTTADLLGGPPDVTSKELLSEWSRVPVPARRRALQMLRLLNGAEEAE